MQSGAHPLGQSVHSIELCEILCGSYPSGLSLRDAFHLAWHSFFSVNILLESCQVIEGHKDDLQAVLHFENAN